MRFGPKPIPCRQTASLSVSPLWTMQALKEEIHP